MSTQYKKLFRSQDDRMVAGVCGGLGEYFDIDPTLMRLIFVFGSIVTGSGLFWVYLVMMILVPEEIPASEAVVTTTAEEVE
ncbi:MAG: PspC domain-containing protein [Anaerolineales bacterium]|nr:PspC domain-containing protein [Chloroflexota bacterium]MBL6981403.1 PspC domain-containing protein [Anaerolineales bacterium]